MLGCSCLRNFLRREVSLLSPSFGFFQSFQPTPQTSHFAFLHKTSTFSFARPSVLYTSSVTSETLSIPNWVPKTREPSPPQPFWKMDGNKGEEENYAAGAVVKVLEEVESCRKENSPKNHQVRLVAVSKLKPASMVRACYDVGHRSFGENYVQELIEKSQELPSDIEWHFIGSLQTNKVKPLLKKVPFLSFLETITSVKLANEVEKAVARLIASGERKEKLRVFVQVNTSGEESKSGVSPSDCSALVAHLLEKCPNLIFSGLMTIGRPDASADQPDFVTLITCRNEVLEKLKLEEKDVELSMGMSADFREAIKFGSTNIRVGSTIFGTRPKKN